MWEAGLPSVIEYCCEKEENTNGSPSNALREELSLDATLTNICGPPYVLWVSLVL